MEKSILSNPCGSAIARDFKINPRDVNLRFVGFDLGFKILSRNFKILSRLAPYSVRHAFTILQCLQCIHMCEIGPREAHVRQAFDSGDSPSRA